MAAVAAVLNSLRCLFSLSWLTGPIFDKELRVSSRRRRNYVLRFVYLAFLTAFLALVWVVVMRFADSALLQMSQMAEAGKRIIAYIVWFQFIVTQIVAVIMLSTSISDEIYSKTLGLLMTTPVNSFQIVMGKLFSKLLQLILLLAISLPLLAVVRVFGGVPWSYVVSSLSITFTTIIFLGSLSLFFSIFTRKAYVCIIMTCLTAGILFALIPIMSFMIWDVLDLNTVIPEKTLFPIILSPNPYCNMFFNTMLMTVPRAAAGGMPVISWPLHCGMILAASAVLLSICVIRVRKVALRQATGQLGILPRKRRKGGKVSAATADRDDFAAPTRRVTGPPIVWKELRFPLLGRRKSASLVVIALCLLILFVTYLLCAMENILDDDEIHNVYAFVFVGIGVLFTTVLASTSITSEKEARSWPLLLATPLDDNEILFGKFVGIARRCFPAWLLLLGHTVVFSLTGIIHPVAILQMALLASWIIGLLAGTGVYFSTCFKRTTTAVLLNFAVVVTLWAMLPFLLAMLGAVDSDLRPMVEVYMDTNPFVHAVVIMEAAVSDPGNYRWVSFGSSELTGAFGSTVWMLICAAVYVSVGFLFSRLAKKRLRRNVF
ncbi:MAG: ABC transporter permease subunit [Phycisphaerales bacterium]|nr:MAG: ABC transporter permease subunit [Phycisphaerales bacterium]